MALVYIRSIDFHIANDKEKNEIMSLYKKKIIKVWLKRLCIFLTIGLICFVFQTLVRLNMPWKFSEDQTISRLFTNISAIFVGINILSWLELLLERELLFAPEKSQIAKLRVKSKIHSEILTVMRQQKWFITCETDEGMIEDTIIVRNKSDFNNIEKGQMVYVERTQDDGHYRYYYLA